MKIAIGYTSDDTLSQPVAINNIQSSVSPGVACYKDEAGTSFDCILAYVDQSDAYGSVRVRHFRATAGTYRYTITSTGFYYSLGANVRTTCGIAAWYNTYTEKWYIAIRRLIADQAITVYSSSDGTSWSYETTFSHAATGPAAASYYAGTTNALVYVK